MKFTEQLFIGINYYRNMIPILNLNTGVAVQELQQQLLSAEENLNLIFSDLQRRTNEI